MPDSADRHPGHPELAAALLNGERSLPDELRSHLANCAACAKDADEFRDLHTRVQHQTADEEARVTPRCPSEERWLMLAARIVEPAEAASLVAHAADCKACSEQLRVALEDVGTETSGADGVQIAALATASHAQQAALAARMQQAMCPRTKTRSRRRLFWWAVPAFAALIAVAAFVAKQQSGPSSEQVYHLIATAYTQQRPIEMRIEGAAYSGLRQSKGWHASQIDQPELQQAHREVEKRSSNSSLDGSWRRTSIRLAVVEGDYNKAIALAAESAPDAALDPSASIDLAIAYVERGDSKSYASQRTADYESALQLLNVVLQAHRDDLTARFNRALVLERLGREADAKAAWRDYLQSDSTSGWSGEAQSHLQ